ncbi:carboxylate-amine ligase [Desulfatitalea alkaliphila]|uniref:Glutamate-cysteine ligase family protein n=1 Tax=Desulfatitalea alkaliphila TaxID=2929485 RepID=A0AA41R7Y3_9BACT|nr:glutamate-cysteine ligase family protein [Desulfatitalea alkaliphila]MCJ8502646.1 glutamate-cysteine ligase family protein [Desulfatitalea alkaliphila]
MSAAVLHLFDAIGIELEYMIVDRDTLAVLPVADRILAAAAGKVVSELSMGPLAWSNELVLHVIELKTEGPAPTLTGMADAFQADVRRIDDLAAPLNGRLMPTGCHPWMDPQTETVLWPHEYSPVYQAYNRIFGCRGHGWSNLQSMHINLPFQGDEEFARLHGAIRLLLPIMPALTASSPILDGRPTGYLDNRMAVYRHNADRVPAVAGHIVPEPVCSAADYDRQIYNPMFAAIGPLDPDGVLRQPFLNSRGAIARFERGAIEIRVLDVQECPAADLAVAALVQGALRALCRERWGAVDDMQALSTEHLADLLTAVIRRADDAVIEDRAYLRLLGVNDRAATAGEVWRHLAAACVPESALDPALAGPLRTMLQRGCLARRILHALGQNPHQRRLAEIYRALCDCLHQGTMFDG